MSQERPSAGNLTGSLLVAHPNLLDPNFRRTILFLSHHTAEDGAVGLVLNRPLHKTFGEVARKEQSGPLGTAGLFYGGPVAVDHVTIASLLWQKKNSGVAFQNFTTSNDDVEISPEWQSGLRVFVGYAGWSKGQLEGEIAQKSWLVLSPARELIEMPDPENAWRNVMRQSGPLMKLLGEAPDDPELN